MMDLPLATMTASSTSPAGTTRGGHREDPEGFAAALTSILGDAGQEVTDMVEALETLADLQDAERAELGGVGWPLPAFLALTGEQAAVPSGELGDQATDEVEALLGQLLESVEPVAGDAAGGDAAVLDEQADALAELLLGEDAAVAPAEGAAGASDEGLAAGRDDIEQALAAAIAASQAAATGAAADGEEAHAQDAAGRGRVVAATEATTPDAGDRTAGRTAESARTAETARTTAAGDTGRVPTGPPTAVTADAAGAEAGAEPTATLSGLEASRRGAADRAAGLPTAIQRIMEAVERLENQPPPRQLTLELGEVRLRVSMEDGHVRLSLLDGDSDAGDELLRDAEQELAQRGFDLGEDAGGSSDRDAWSGETAGPARRQPGAAHRGTTPDPTGALRL